MKNIDRAYTGLRIEKRMLKVLKDLAELPHKFNVTVTMACMSLIAERMQSAHYDSAEDFLARNTDMFFRTGLTSLYSEAQLTSGLARTVALLPDTGALMQ